MLENISSYIKNIAFFLIFTSFIGIILPNGKYKKYIDVVLGLILVIVTLEPAAGFFFGSARPFDKALDEITASLIYETSGAVDDENTRERLITQEFAERIKPQLEALVSDHSFTLEEFDFSVDINSGEMSGLSMTISEHRTNPTPAPFIRVERVRIDNSGVKDEMTEKIESGEINGVKKSVSDFYNIPLDNIHINVLRKS